ncbi:hypothetical protein MXAN_1494 [Myxococcus xanthus DK 1622]|uniref:Uncharacterized protein n=1 Tax=Myxococcus xanthus (strain DK1622) TaxID=246197 RepID=Q1DC77_MYXXD|nr:hypothetical protein MXAN_1494 [Myxococcus xanthus DK 1622]
MRAGIVAEHDARHAAEVPEGLRQPLQPVLLTLGLLGGASVTTQR